MYGDAHFPKSQTPAFTGVFTRRRFIQNLLFLTAALLIHGLSLPESALSAPESKSFLQKMFPKQDALSGDRKTPTMETLTIIGSRLPAFKIPFSDVPANVSYIPANVTQKDQSAIQLTRPLHYQETIRDTESAVLYDQVGNGLDATFALRGFSEGSSVVTLLDGVRLNDVDGGGVTYPLIDMSDVESIQIDRGSASPIFGSGAFGGVVHLLTRKPSEKPVSLFGGVDVASHRGIRFYNGVSGTVADKWTPVGGKLQYYFKGGRNLSDGYRDNGESRITSFNIKSAYELPDDRGRIHAGVKHVTDAISNPGTLNLRQYDENAEQTIKPLDGRDYKNTVVQVGADAYFWDKRISGSVLASWRTNLTHFYTTSATFTDFADGFNPDTNLVTTKDRAMDFVWQAGYQDRWTEWLENQTTLGMEFRDASNYGLQQDAFGGNVVETTARETERSAKPQNVGLFWRESLEFWDRVIPHFGMRHDFHRLKTTDHLTPTDNLSRTFSDTAVSTGVTLKPFSWNDVFFNYSQGFRVPDISELAPFSGTISSGLQPEHSDSYEIGTRLRYKKKAALKTSFFLIDLSDEIVFDSTSTGPAAPFGQNRNIAKSRRQGVESRLDLKPVPELDMFGSYTWTEAYVRETNPTGSIIDGRSLGQIPEHRITAGFFITPFARQDELLSGLKTGFSGVWTGAQHPQNYESTSQATLNATGGAGHIIKDYSVWDYILSYAWRRQEIYFKITNMFDNKYYSRAIAATSFGTAIQPAGTFAFVVPGAPREFQLGVRWEI